MITEADVLEFITDAARKLQATRGKNSLRGSAVKISCFCSVVPSAKNAGWVVWIDPHVKRTPAPLVKPWPKPCRN